MKRRIIESADGFFYPQCKTSIFRRWRYYTYNADTTASLHESRMLTTDYVGSARFDTEQAALKFMARVTKRVDAYWSQFNEAKRRKENALKVKRVVIEFKD